MCVQVTKTAIRFEISSLLEKILLKQVRWCLTFVGLYSLICSFLITISLCLCLFIYSPTKVKHHLTYFNYICSNTELISNRFAIFVTCTHILTYLWNRLLIDFYLCVYDRVCKVPRVLFNICVCERKLICFVQSFKFHFLLVLYGAANINHIRKVASCWHA